MGSEKSDLCRRRGVPSLVNADDFGPPVYGVAEYMRSPILVKFRSKPREIGSYPTDYDPRD